MMERLAAWFPVMLLAAVAALTVEGYRSVTDDLPRSPRSVRCSAMFSARRRTSAWPQRVMRPAGCPNRAASTSARHWTPAV